jgi:hypothetical protein
MDIKRDALIEKRILSWQFKKLSSVSTWTRWLIQKENIFINHPIDQLTSNES